MQLKNKIVKMTDNDIIHIIYTPLEDKVEFINITQNQRD